MRNNPLLCHKSIIKENSVIHLLMVCGAGGGGLQELGLCLVHCRYCLPSSQVFEGYLS